MGGKTTKDPFPGLGKTSIPKPANPKFNTAAKSHRVCLDQLVETDKLYSEVSALLRQMEKRLEASFEATKEAQDKILAERTKWSGERHDLNAKIKQLEEDVKHERRRATQALDVAESTSDAAGGIGRLLRTLVDDNVMEQLRISHQEREQRARDSMRHRRPV